MTGGARPSDAPLATGVSSPGTELEGDGDPTEELPAVSVEVAAVLNEIKRHPMYARVAAILPKLDLGSWIYILESLVYSNYLLSKLDDAEKTADKKIEVLYHAAKEINLLLQRFPEIKIQDLIPIFPGWFESYYQEDTLYEEAGLCAIKKAKNGHLVNQDSFLISHTGEAISVYVLDGVSGSRRPEDLNLLLHMYLCRWKKLPDTAVLKALVASDRLSPSSALVACRITYSDIAFAKLGDCRIVALYNDGCIQSSVDAIPLDWTGDVVENQPHPQSNVVYHSYPGEIRFDEGYQCIKKILLFSDGIGDNLPQTRINEIFKDANKTGEEKVLKLKAEALIAMEKPRNFRQGRHYGKPDDLVVVIIDVAEVRANFTSS